MRHINRLVLLSLSITSMAMAQLPFFLQRFRPVRHNLLSSGSSSYPSFASSLFPLSASSSLLSPTYGPPSSFLSSSSLSSLPFSSSGLSSLPFSSSGLSSLSLSPLSASGSSLSPHFGANPLSSSSFGSALYAPSSFGSPSFSSGHLSSPSFPSSHLSLPSFTSSHLNLPSFGSSHLGSPHRFAAASNLAQSFDLGSVGEGMGSFDQSELLDDYQGFSNAGFAKDLNFAGSDAVKFQSQPPAPYNGEQLVYLQRSEEK